MFGKVRVSKFELAVEGLCGSHSAVETEEEACS